MNLPGLFRSEYHISHEITYASVLMVIKRYDKHTPPTHGADIQYHSAISTDKSTNP